MRPKIHFDVATVWKAEFTGIPGGENDAISGDFRHSYHRLRFRRADNRTDDEPTGGCVFAIRSNVLKLLTRG